MFLVQFFVEKMIRETWISEIKLVSKKTIFLFSTVKNISFLHFLYSKGDLKKINPMVNVSTFCMEYDI